MRPPEAKSQGPDAEAPPLGLGEGLFFLREFLRNFRLTGSFWPTSSTAAQVLTFPLHAPRQGLNILEIGPGTGAVTKVILGAMTEADRLGLCEINPRFMSRLQRKLNNDDTFLAHAGRVEFLQCAAQDIAESQKYDIIVCSLPFLNFDVETVKAIFGKLGRLGHASTLMTFYEYLGLRSLNALLVSSHRRKNVRAVEDFLDANGRRPHARVWRNVLPLQVYSLTVPQTSERQPLDSGGCSEAADELSAKTWPRVA